MSINISQLVLPASRGGREVQWARDVTARGDGTGRSAEERGVR